jgi:hypothetical protein
VCSDGENNATLHKAGDGATRRKARRGVVRKERTVVDERVIVVTSLNKNCIDEHGRLTLLLF